MWSPLFLNLLVLVGLSAWFVRRYAAALPWAGERRAWARWRPPVLLSGLPLRWPGRAAALIWLDLRQSVPLAFAGLTLAFFMAVAGIYLAPHPPSLWPTTGDPSVAAIACGVLPGSTWIVALLWSAIVGSGIYGAELQPGLGNFWRSRPIAASSWFWTKFAVGLVAVLSVLDGVTIALSWNSPYASGADRMSLSYVACMPPLHGLLYALAVLGVCSLRRPVGRDVRHSAVFSAHDRLGNAAEKRVGRSYLRLQRTILGGNAVSGSPRPVRPPLPTRLRRGRRDKRSCRPLGLSRDSALAAGPRIARITRVFVAHGYVA